MHQNVLFSNKKSTFWEGTQPAENFSSPKLKLFKLIRGYNLLNDKAGSLVNDNDNKISHVRHHLTVMCLGVCGTVGFAEQRVTDFCQIIWHFTVCSNNSFSKKHSTLRRLDPCLFCYLSNTHE